MPGKVTTRQLAMSVLKGRREEAKLLLDRTAVGNSRNLIILKRIEELDKEIEVIENPIEIKEN